MLLSLVYSSFVGCSTGLRHQIVALTWNASVDDRPTMMRRGSTLHIDRRTFLKAATAAATVSLAVVGWFPPARKAKATHNYDTGTLIYDWPPCPNYGTNGFYDLNDGSACDEACGPSIVHANACWDSGQWAGWHRDHSSGSQLEWNLRPNDCYGQAPNTDGWK